MIWTDGSVLFLFGKGGFGVLANCSLCGTETPFRFWRAQYVRFFTEACATLKALAGLGSTSNHFFSLLFSCSLTLAMSLPLCSLLHFFYLKLSAYLARTVISCGTIRLQSVPGHSFFWGTTRLRSRPDGSAFRALCNPLWSLTSRIHSSLFWTGGVLPHLNSSTHRFSRCPLKN